MQTYCCCCGMESKLAKMKSIISLIYRYVCFLLRLNFQNELI